MSKDKLTIKLPKKLNILGTTYKVLYVDKPSDADAGKRLSLWGQIDHWENIIRIYSGSERTLESTWKVLLHEIVHGIVQEYCINEILQLHEEDQERVVDTLATGLFDTLVRNKMLRIRE